MPLPVRAPAPPTPSPPRIPTGRGRTSSTPRATSRGVVASRRGWPPRPPSKPAPVARPTHRRRGPRHGAPGRAPCGWWRPPLAPRQRSPRCSPRRQPYGPCCPRRRRCSRSASSRASPGTRSGNGASPRSRRGGTRRSGSSPLRRGPCDAWRWWAARSTRPTSRPRPPSRPTMPSSGSMPWYNAADPPPDEGQPGGAGHGPAGRAAHKAPALGDGGPGGGGARAAGAHPAASRGAPPGG